MKKEAVWILFLVLLSASVFAHEDFYGDEPADDHVDLYMFKTAGCGYCARMHTFLEDLQEKEPRLNVHEYDLKQNKALFFQMAAQYNLEVSERSVKVPIVFIHEKVIVGYNDDVTESLERYVGHCIEEMCRIPDDGNTTQTIGPTYIFNPLLELEKLTIPAVVIAAAVDAINPCAFAVLIILLTTILATKSRKKALWAGLAFSSSIFISYFLMGLGLFSAIQAAGVTKLMYSIVAVLAILVGLFNLKDYMWYGKWFIMEVPPSWRPKMKILLKGVTSVPGAFLMGFIISLFLLPCTSGPYIVILGLLAHAATRASAISLLLLYNLIFVLPMLIITFAIYFKFTTTEKAEHWRTRKLKTLHLIAGILILIIGIVMVGSIILGYV